MSKRSRRTGGSLRRPSRAVPPPGRSRVPWLLGAGAVVVLILAAAGLVLASGGSLGTTPAAGSTGSQPPAGSLPGISTRIPPWPPQTADLRARLDALGMPALSAEGAVLHIHQHIDILIDGKAVAVPADIGIDAAAGFLSETHTHDATGIIHVESPTNTTFRLGQFFDIWGVRFNSHCIGGECDGNVRTLAVFVNGHRVDGDPRAIILEEQQEIAVVLGTQAQLADAPATYNFPSGL